MSETKKIRAAIVGYGNVGRYALEALEAAEDFELEGVIRRNPEQCPEELKKYHVVGSVDELQEVDVAILSVPTRKVAETAVEYLKRGISTVDSFDIHSEIVALRAELGEVARANNARAVIAAGWDPGSDSVVRTLMQAIVPKGITYTDFGPGMSMGHSVAAKAIDGVHKALSMTIPTGTGVHRRMVYIEVKDGYNESKVIEAIKADTYFASDETHVIVVDDVDALQDVGHAVAMQRKGVSGQTHNQIVRFEMSINNPALTSQIMVAAARAALRQAPGAYTMQEIPVIDLLPGERESWIQQLC